MSRTHTYTVIDRDRDCVTIQRSDGRTTIVNEPARAADPAAPSSRDDDAIAFARTYGDDEWAAPSR